MNKQTEALKLAIKALEETRNALAWFYDSYPQDVTQRGSKLLPHVETVLTAIREALAEQPAQQQKPVKACVTGKCPCKSECNSAQHCLYTSPPASKPWVPLTDEEMRELEKQFNAERVRTSDEEYLIIYPGDYWAWQRAIEAKLREKNQ